MNSEISNLQSAIHSVPRSAPTSARGLRSYSNGPSHSSDSSHPSHVLGAPSPNPIGRGWPTGPGEGSALTSDLCPLSSELPTFSIAGFRYYDGAEALPELQPGTSLTLRAQPDNPHDPFAVEILHGRTKLGYVPRFCNRQLSRLLQSDVSLTCAVAHVRTDAPPWDAVAVRVSLSEPEYQEAA